VDYGGWDHHINLKDSSRPGARTVAILKAFWTDLGEQRRRVTIAQ